jgi:hypothetical protein
LLQQSWLECRFSMAARQDGTVQLGPIERNDQCLRQGFGVHGPIRLGDAFLYYYIRFIIILRNGTILHHGWNIKEIVVERFGKRKFVGLGNPQCCRYWLSKF